MKKASILFSATLLTGALLVAMMVETMGHCDRYSPNAQSFEVKAIPVNASAQTISTIEYKVVTSMRSVKPHESLILWISTSPENFVRDKMILLAHQLNRDFSDEAVIHATIFDSEEDARHYNPAGGMYEISRELVRGEYRLDRVRHREDINFSRDRGESIMQVAIVMGGKAPGIKKKKSAK